MSNILYIFLAVALVLLNAFFVAAEFSMVKLRSTRLEVIKKTHGLRGKILDQVHQHLDTYLSACQLGITLASLGLGWVGEPAFAHLLEPIFTYLSITSSQFTVAISFATAFFIISFLHIVIGELMPKSLAIRQAELISIWTAPGLYLFYWVMYPIIWILNTCSNLLLKLVGLSEFQQGENFYSSDELKVILSSSFLHGEISQEETDIIEHTLDLAELSVTEVMRPYSEMVMLQLQEPIHSTLQKIVKHRYSRYPVFDQKKNIILGVIHVKDLFAAMIEGKQIESLMPFIRPILKVSHQSAAMDLFRKFRAGMPHFAVVYKTKDTMLGFVTLDNLLHILFGRVRDEFHKTQDDWIKNEDGTITAKGDCSIYSLEQALDRDITLTSDEVNLDTLAGLMIVRAGTLPKVNDKIEFKEFSAIIQEMEGSSIKKIHIIPT